MPQLKEMAFSDVCSLGGASAIAEEIAKSIAEKIANKAKGLFTGSIEPLRKRVIREARVHILSLKDGVSAGHCARRKNADSH